MALAEPPAMPAQLHAFVSLHLGKSHGQGEGQAFLQARASKSHLGLDLATMNA